MNHRADFRKASPDANFNVFPGPLCGEALVVGDSVTVKTEEVDCDGCNAAMVEGNLTDDDLTWKQEYAGA